MLTDIIIYVIPDIIPVMSCRASVVAFSRDFSLQGGKASSKRPKVRKEDNRDICQVSSDGLIKYLKIYTLGMVQMEGFSA